MDCGIDRGSDIPVRWDGLSPPEPLSFDNSVDRGCTAVDVNADGSRIVGRC